MPEKPFVIFTPFITPVKMPDELITKLLTHFINTYDILSYWIQVQYVRTVILPAKIRERKEIELISMSIQYVLLEILYSKYF